MIAAASPFASALAVPFQLKPINQRYELNQMDWKAIGKVYTGLALTMLKSTSSRTKIDETLRTATEAAHHGILPATAADNSTERQVREKVDVVETVLTDLCLQLLPFFSNALHADRKGVWPTPIGSPPPLRRVAQVSGSHVSQKRRDPGIGT